MTDFKSVSLADQVFEKLENDIITGVYPRGEILTELKLVEQLGVSRTPIREALRRLEQERCSSIDRAADTFAKLLCAAVPATGCEAALSGRRFYP